MRNFILDHIASVATVFAIVLIFIPLPELFLNISFILTWGLCLLLFFTVQNSKEKMLSLPRKILFLTLLILALEISYSRIILSVEMRIRINPDTCFKYMYIINIIVAIMLLLLAFRFIRKGVTVAVEAAARFALDSMNQKIFDIDNKVVSGSISKDEAEKQKDNLRKEIDFYSNLVGISKFFIGNMKALIFLYVISIAGGSLYGVHQYGYSVHGALNIVSLTSLLAAIYGSLCMTFLAACVTYSTKDIKED